MRRITLSSAARYQALEACVDALNAGEVIAAPTETVYGLMALWSNEAGRKKIFEMKKRPKEKHLQMLALNLSSSYKAGVKENPILEKLNTAFWPGPLTVICNGNNDNTIGLRIPKHDFIQQLLAKLNPRSWRCS